MTEPRDQVLQTIRVALAQNDRRAAFVLLRKALEQDVTDQEIWHLLHTHFSMGVSFTEFQETFLSKHFQGYKALPTQLPYRRQSRRWLRFDFDPTTAGFLAGNFTGSLGLIGLYALLQRNVPDSILILIPILCGGFTGMASSYWAILRLRRKIRSWQRYIIGVGIGAISGLVIAPTMLIAIGLILRLLFE